MNRSKIQGLAQLQELTLGNSAIKIAVLDGPVDLKHPCFNTIDGKLLPVDEKQIHPSSKANLALNHGTAVASLIFGKPGSKIEGVAPGCSSLFIPIYSNNPDGTFNSATQVNLARSITLAIEQGAHVINISGGQFSTNGDAETFLQNAINKCYKAGVLIVAATGNEGCRCLHVPASDNQVLAVGSMDENGEPTKMTNYGDAYKVNGILAPGKNLKAALPNGGSFLTGGGTSYATPVVSGIVGLLMSLQKQRGIKPDAYVIKSILEQTAIPCNGDGKKDCNRFLRGTLNLPAAIAAINKNPGILASGIEFTNTLNIESMKENIKQESEQNVHSTHEAGELLPSEIPSESLMEKSENTQEQGTNLTNGEKNKSVNELNPSDEAVAEPEPQTAEVTPSSNENEINVSAQNIPLININNQTKEKMEKMENNIKLEKMDTNNKTVTAEEISPSNETTSVNPLGEVEETPGVDPSDCGCGGGDKPTIVYALGTLDYDFGSESHRDSFVQSMGGANPNDPAQLLKHLKSNPWDAEELYWTLNIDQTPVYALMPNGAHAHAGYEKIRDILEDQLNGNIQRISVPGVAKGTSSLLMGHSVTNLFPRLRGIYSWTTEALVSASTSGAKGSTKALAENVTNFLNRVYYKMRNLGATAEERALNYAATNAFQVSYVFAAALKENLELNDISASKSPICRPGSDCYDVVLSFFNPKERLTQARKEYRFTIDVSDIVPVTVGTVRSWSVY